jgi:hypothetical protein
MARTRYYATVEVWIGDIESDDEAHELENAIEEAVGGYQNTVSLTVHEYPQEA